MRDNDRRVYAPDFLIELFTNPLDAGYADAAARRARTGPPAPRTRRLSTAGSAIALALIGFLLAVAYLHVLADEPGRTRARAGLVAQINALQSGTDALQRRASTLREEVARQRDAALGSEEAARLREDEAATGLARVRGDGLVVRVADAPSAVDAVTGAGDDTQGKVLDQDLQGIANALWAAGAEAIAINDQRLATTTAIRRAGGAIQVDFRPIAGPYEIVAIGPDRMRDRFEDSDSAALMRYLVDTFGLSFRVDNARNVTLEAATEPQLRYAEPAASTFVGPSPDPSGTGSPQPSTDPSTTPTGGGR